MSVSAGMDASASAGRGSGAVRNNALLFAGGALLAVGAALALGAWAFGSYAIEAAPQSPFATGFAEPSPTGALGALLVSLQSRFYQALTGALDAFAAGRRGPWPLIAIGFIYGVFHAAGPGHGKAVIAGYLFADGKTAARGFLLSLAAAVTQGIVAVGLVTVCAVLLGGTAAMVTSAARAIELASFAAIALVGARLTWRKAQTLAAAGRPPETAGGDCACCDDGHIASPEIVERAASDWRRAAGVVLAAGLRPCSGAVILLVFALSQQMFVAGVATTFAVALGAALTTGALAALAVSSRRLALGVIARRANGGRAWRGALAAAELAVAAVVFWMGAALLIGLWSSPTG